VKLGIGAQISRPIRHAEASTHTLDGNEDTLTPGADHSLTAAVKLCNSLVVFNEGRESLETMMLLPFMNMINGLTCQSFTSSNNLNYSPIIMSM